MLSVWTTRSPFITFFQKVSFKYDLLSQYLIFNILISISKNVYILYRDYVMGLGFLFLGNSSIQNPT